MKRRICPALLICICLLMGLCACGKDKPDPQQIMQHYIDRAFTAQYIVTTHAGFHAEYRLDCQHENGVSRVTILAPESVAGICAVVQDAGAVLQFEDISLDALLPEISGYAPMDALHVLVAQLGSKQADYYSYEADKVTLEYRWVLPDGSECMKTVVLHPETLDLQSAECYLDGNLIIAVCIEQIGWVS